MTEDNNQTMDNLSIDDKFDQVIATLKSLMNEVKELKKEAKKSQKKKKIPKEVDPNKPVPFSQPVVISSELRDFLNVEGDISRTSVTKKIYEYIKVNNLQNQDAKKNFFLDNKLSKLFNLEKGSQVEYFRVQTHLKQHYPK